VPSSSAIAPALISLVVVFNGVDCLPMQKFESQGWWSARSAIAAVEIAKQARRH
jgi:hypothetical protein